MKKQQKVGTQHVEKRQLSNITFSILGLLVWPFEAKDRLFCLLNLTMVGIIRRFQWPRVIFDRYPCSHFSSVQVKDSRKTQIRT